MRLPGLATSAGAECDPRRREFDPEPPARGRHCDLQHPGPGAEVPALQRAHLKAFGNAGRRAELLPMGRGSSPAQGVENGPSLTRESWEEYVQ